VSIDLGIVIVNWNVRDLLAACLDSVYAELAASATTLSGVVCVVDNGSRDGSVEMLRSHFPRTRLIQADNRGMGAGNNLGLRLLAAEYSPAAYMILNPDTIVRPGALRHLVGWLRTRPPAGVVAPKLLNPNGTLQHSGFRYPGLVQLAWDLFPPPRPWQWLRDSPCNGRYPPWAYATSAPPFQVEHTLGAAFVVRDLALAQCGLFDEAFYLYCEEIDWQWRLCRAGWECWIVPQAEIVHYGGQSTTQTGATALFHLWRSRHLLYHRYHRPLTNLLAGWLVRYALRRRIYAYHQPHSRGLPPSEQRAQLTRVLTEIIHLWQS